MSLSTLIAQVKSINSTRQDVGAAFDEVQDLFEAWGYNASTTTINTNSTSASVMSGSDITINCPSAGSIFYLCSLMYSGSSAASSARVEIFANGTRITGSGAWRGIGFLESTGGTILPMTVAVATSVGAGSNTVDTRWYSAASSITHYSSTRYAWAFFLPS